jgi:hypothetical protein
MHINCVHRIFQIIGIKVKKLQSQCLFMFYVTNAPWHCTKLWETHMRKSMPAQLEFDISCCMFSQNYTELLTMYLWSVVEMTLCININEMRALFCQCMLATNWTNGKLLKLSNNNILNDWKIKHIMKFSCFLHDKYFYVENILKGQSIC